jgi:pimeloyl-ACP methyl ester carboxylesterase
MKDPATKTPPTTGALRLAAEAPAPARVKRIVLVDASPLYAEAWRAVFAARYGPSVTFEAYADPLEALPRLGEDVSLLMVDLELPLFGGRKVLELAKQRGVAGRRIVINFDFTDTGRKYALTLENGTLNHVAGKQAAKADTTFRMTRADFDNVMLQRATLDSRIQAGEVKVDGDPRKFGELMALLDTFEFWFNIVTP